MNSAGHGGRDHMTANIKFTTPPLKSYEKFVRFEYVAKKVEKGTPKKGII